MNTLTAKNDILNEFDGLFQQLDLLEEQLTKEVKMFTEDHYSTRMSELHSINGTLNSIDECICSYNVEKCPSILEKTKRKLNRSYTYKLGY